VTALSAGLLVYRRRGGRLEVLLVHPGGPYFRKKDHGSWSVPKGLVEQGESMPDAARREFREETGVAAPEGALLELGEIHQAGGKRVRAWAAEGDIDPASISGNRFELEWPPRSGHLQSFPEVDRGAFFGLDEARARVVPAQRALVDRLERALEGGSQ
jgi:predicted NUDIX family NTP pyrophosphohydrolase